MKPNQRNGDTRVDTPIQINRRNHVAALDYRNSAYRAHHGRGVVHTEGPLHWCRLGEGTFNIFYGADLPDDAAPGIRLANERCADWGETSRWFVSSGDSPRDLADRVESHGWEYGYAWTEMNFDLAERDIAAPEPDIHLERVVDEPSRQAWLRVHAAGFDPPAKLTAFIDELTEALLIDPRCPFELHLARTESGDAAGVGALFVQAETAGIFMVATDPALQRRGVATAVMRGLMLRAREAGCAWCVLQSSDVAETMYRKLGYVKSGVCKVYRRVA